MYPFGHTDIHGYRTYFRYLIRLKLSFTFLVLFSGANRRWQNFGGRRVNGLHRRGPAGNFPSRPDLHNTPGPPYPGPPPRNPNLPLDPTRIHPSEPEPVFRRPGKIVWLKQILS